VPEFGPYEHPQELLRDELWRCWLCVEYQIRQRWALGALARSADDSALGSWAAETLAGVFRSAMSDYRGKPLIDGDDAGASVVLDAYKNHSLLSMPGLAPLCATTYACPISICSCASGSRGRNASR
jgi:hypothetical protein